MTGSLSDELQEAETLVTLIRKGQPMAAPFDTVSASIAVIFRRIEGAWQRAAFSDASDACLHRYFSFHLKRITTCTEHLEESATDHPGRAGQRLLMLEGFRNLTIHLLRSYPEFLDQDLHLPLPYQRSWMRSVRTRTDAVRTNLQHAPISPGLRDCLLAYLAQYEPDAGNCRISCRAMGYFETWLSGLSDLDIRETSLEDRINLLLTDLNFNHLLYLSYHQDRLRNVLSGMPARERAAFLRKEHYQLGIRPEQTRYTYHPDWPSIKTMLSACLREEIGRYQELITDPDPVKIPLNLSVAQLACLIRLCYEEGIFANANLSDIFKTFAAMFSSKRQDHISPGSLSKEYYSISQVTAAVMRDKLAKMTARINRNFFPV